MEHVHVFQQLAIIKIGDIKGRQWRYLKSAFGIIGIEFQSKLSKISCKEVSNLFLKNDQFLELNLSLKNAARRFLGMHYLWPVCYANVPAAIDVNIFLAGHVLALVFDPPIQHLVFCNFMNEILKVEFVFLIPSRRDTTHGTRERVEAMKTRRLSNWRSLSHYSVSSKNTSAS